MGKWHVRQLVIGALCIGLLSPAWASAQGGGSWSNRDERRDPRVLRGYQDPAYARGYSDGWERGADDRQDRDRYDPVRHGKYRDGDDGYWRSYGARDAYKNNYRSGFRQGYEEGYRNGARRRR